MAKPVWSSWKKKIVFDRLFSVKNNGFPSTENREIARTERKTGRRFYSFLRPFLFCNFFFLCFYVVLDGLARQKYFFNIHTGTVYSTPGSTWNDNPDSVGRAPRNVFGRWVDASYPARYNTHTHTYTRSPLWNNCIVHGTEQRNTIVPRRRQKADVEFERFVRSFRPSFRCSSTRPVAFLPIHYWDAARTLFHRRVIQLWDIRPVARSPFVAPDAHCL